MERIQSCWRSYKIRKKVFLFKQLPEELWHIILEYIRKKPDIYTFLNKELNLKLTRLYCISPGKIINRTVKLLYFIRKYFDLLTSEVVEESTRLCFRLLTHYVVPYCHRLLINATLEKINVLHPYIIDKYINLY